MLLEIQRTTMRYFRASTPSGVHYRATRYDDMSCCIVIYPLEDGGGLFPVPEVIWYTDRSQAERHAQDWRNWGHTVEVVEAGPCEEQEYLINKLLTPSQQSL